MVVLATVIVLILGAAGWALGRLTESVEPMRAALEMAIEQENWKSAAIRASNLSELELTLGDVSAAVADGEQSVILEQVTNGLAVRMAVLYLLAGENDREAIA